MGWIILTRSLIKILFFIFFSCSINYAQNNCIECHRKKTGKQAAPVTELQNSIHFENNVLCHNCHGGDPDADTFIAAKGKNTNYIGVPKKEDIQIVCGQCHDKIRQYFAAGPHKEKSKLNCVFCHKNHTVLKASHDLIRIDFCNQCHTHNIEFIDLLKSTLLSSDFSLYNAQSTIAGLAQKDYYSVEFENELKKAYDASREQGQVFHTFDLNEINKKTYIIVSTDEKINSKIEELEKLIRTRKERKLIGIGVVIFLLISAMVLWIYQRNLPLPDYAQQIKK